MLIRNCDAPLFVGLPELPQICDAKTILGTPVKDNPTSIHRSFCGFDQHILPWLAEHLLEKHSSAGLIDLSAITIVVPGGRALRRLMELLVIGAAQGEKIGQGIIPPSIITRGSLIDRFLPSSASLASEITRQMAWISAIHETEKAIIEQLVPNAPTGYIERSAAALARRIDSIYIEISSAGLTFADVAQKGQQIEGFYEEERWDALHAIYLSYKEILSNTGQECRYSRRAELLSETEAFEIPGELYLCGLFDLTPQQKVFLDKCHGSIYSVIFADDLHSNGFDKYGAIVPSYWERQVVNLDSSDLQVVEHPRDIAAATLEWVSEIAPKISERDLVFGLGDEKISGFLKGQFDELGFATRAASGLSALQTETGFLLTVISRYLESRTFEDLAALVRHPYLILWLCEKLLINPESAGSILVAIDNYQPSHLQATTRGALPNDQKNDLLAIKIIDSVHELLAPLIAEPVPVTDWAVRIYQVLEPFSAEIGADVNEIIKSLNDLIDELARCPLATKLRPSEALSLLTDQFEARTTIPDPRDSGIELLGWLELAFDDSAALMVTGLDEGVVPAVINADPFLPDSLARHLGITNNGSRFARDLALFSSIINSKRELRVICTRRSLSGDIVQPSRLLFACDDNELPKRVDTLRQDGQRFKTNVDKVDTRRDYLVSQPTSLIEPITKMSVTSFTSYMNCPYRFYLERVAKVAPASDEVVELDAFRFGTLAHDILAHAGKDSAFNSDSPDIVTELLNDSLAFFTKRVFGKNPLPAVKIQLEQLKDRFALLVEWQVKHRRDGWITKEIERDLAELQVMIELSEDSMQVTGRIDRVDFNQVSNRYLIIDYKTNDKGRSKKDARAEKKIEGSEQKQIIWSDLQAPLYLRAAAMMFGDITKIGFAYVNLPARVDLEIYEPVEVSDLEYQAGISQAREIAQLVRDQVFWPPNSKLVIDPDRDPYWRLLTGLTAREEVLVEEEVDV